MEKKSKWNKIIPIRMIVDKEICGYCEYDGKLCRECAIKNELVKLEENFPSPSGATIKQIYEYCEENKEEYKNLCTTIKIFASSEDQKNG